MYKDVLQAMAGVEIFPIISLLLFVAAFLGVVVYVVRMDRTEVRRCSRLPLDSEDGTIRESLLEVRE